MSTLPDIAELERKLNFLLRKQAAFGKEIELLRQEINYLKTGVAPASVPEARPVSPRPVAPPPPQPRRRRSFAVSDELEKYIGENLISRIGILIMVVGVALGTKYAIDQDWISPVLRIVFGYVIGVLLLIVSVRLKDKFTAFSAVLLSGGMAVHYLVTFAAYEYYGLMPAGVAFAIMLLLTVATVLAAWRYDQQIIAHLGLVGAYAVPFLVGSDSGSVVTLFSYIAIINAGILATALFRYWKSLYLSAFVATWLILLSTWTFNLFNITNELVYLWFGAIYFVFFYITLLLFKLRRQQVFGLPDIGLLLANAFLFYGLAFAILSSQPEWNRWLGLFTLLYAQVHGVAFLLVQKRSGVDPKLADFLLGLAIVFVVLAVPVQFDGNWVTLFWALGAAVLFWIDWRRDTVLLRNLAFPLLLLAFFSLLQDRAMLYWDVAIIGEKSAISPLLNLPFLLTLPTLLAFAFIWYIHDRQRPNTAPNLWGSIAPSLLTGILLVSIYYIFYTEIDIYWYQQAILATSPALSVVAGQLGQIWLLHYTLFVLTVVAVLNIRWLHNQLLAYINLFLQVFFLFVTLFGGLYLLSELREAYQSGVVFSGTQQLYLRYITWLFVAGLLVGMESYLRDFFPARAFRVAFELLLALTVVWLLSSELLHWLDLAGSRSMYKQGLSILWGSYALLLIGIGIWLRKKHLRIAAMVLLGVTLIKLFVYDIASVSTGSKIVVLVSLGGLLLVASYLYNRYADTMQEE